MNTAQMLELLYSHPVGCEIGAEMHPGFPFYEVQDGTLYVQLLPHREIAFKDKTDFYAPAYRMRFAYPFVHLSSFENLALDRVGGSGRLVQTGKGEDFQKQYSEAMAEIFKMSDHLLAETEKQGCPSEQTLEQYQQTLLQKIRTLKLADVYGVEEREQDVYRCNL